MSAAPRPAPTATRPYHFPAFERRTLDNGLALIVASVSKLPVATLSVITEAGAVCDPKGREGIADLVSDLVLEGTAAMSGAELADRFERLGATIETEAGWDVSAVSLTALTRNFGAAVRLLGDALRAPAFPASELARLRDEHRADLIQLRTEPRGLADEMFVRVVYEAASRYACPIGGTERSLAAITQDHVRQFHADRFRAGGVTVVVVGDLSAAAAERLVRDAFAEWPRGTPSPAATPDGAAHPVRRLHLVAKEDAAQAELRLGHVGARRDTPDYFPLVVLNAVLGGLFSSRVNLNLRERNGYTYGAFSRFDWRRQAGPVVVSTAVATDVTAPAAREALLEFERIRQEEITADELSLATSYLDGVFPIRFETTASIAGALASMASFNLPDDYHDTYRERIRSVSTADVLRVARAHLKPEALQLLVVGDAAKIRGPLEALAFGPLSTYTPADLP